MEIFLSSINAVAGRPQSSTESRWTSGGPICDQNTGRVPTERRTCTLKGVEAY